MDNLVLDLVNQNQAVDANYQFTAVGQDATDTYACQRENVKEDPLMNKILVANEFNIAEAVSIYISPRSSFRQTLDQTCNVLNIPVSNDLTLLLKPNDYDTEWFEEDHFLEDYNICEGMMIKVFRKVISFQVTSPHFRCKPAVRLVL